MTTTDTSPAALITGALPNEVVTRALVRDVDLPGGAGRLALVTLDNGRDHTRPSTFGPAGLAELDRALDAVAGRASSQLGAAAVRYSLGRRIMYVTRPFAARAPSSPRTSASPKAIVPPRFRIRPSTNAAAPCTAPR